MKSQEGSKPAERLNGSEILVRALAEEGVEYVFGYPGGSVLNILTRSISRINSNTFLFDTNKVQLMLQMPTPEHLIKSA